MSFTLGPHHTLLASVTDNDETKFNTAWHYSLSYELVLPCRFAGSSEPIVSRRLVNCAERSPGGTAHFSPLQPLHQP